MPKLSGRALAQRLKAVKVALMDIDGVLSSGHVFHMVDGSGALIEFKGVNAQDSISLSWLAEAGIRTGFISGRNSLGMQERLKMLKASWIYQGRLDKMAVFAEILAAAGVGAEQALYIGDDLPDIPVVAAAGLGVAVANARPEVKAAADWVTRARGGEAAVREVSEALLKAQGHWVRVLEKYAPGRAAPAGRTVQ